MRILIIQPHIPEYRIAFFEAISKEFGNLTILHFGNKMRFENSGCIHEMAARKVKVGSLVYITNLHKIVRKYDVVIAIFDPHWINSFLAPILFPDMEVIFWGHGFGRNILINKLRILLVRRADALITYSQKARDEFVEKGINPDKIFVAPNTIQVGNHQDTSSCKKRSLLFVGRLQRRKKLDLLLIAFMRLRLHDKEININIIGSGDAEKNHLMKMVDELNIGKWVNFIDGTTDDEKLKNYFSEAYAYVSPGHVGLGVLHSFAYGVPVVTMMGDSHAPEVSNIIQDKTGFICKDFDMVLSVIDKITGSDVYRRIGSSAYEHYVQKRQLMNMVNGFRDAINGVK